MEELVFSLWDAKLEQWLPPFTAATFGMAERMMRDAMRQDTPLARYPGDYTLYQIGTFSQRTGALAAVPPVSMGLLAQFKTTGGE